MNQTVADRTLTLEEVQALLEKPQCEGCPDEYTFWWKCPIHGWYNEADDDIST
jgi:hypothetical protein